MSRLVVGVDSRVAGLPEMPFGGGMVAFRRQDARCVLVGEGEGGTQADGFQKFGQSRVVFTRTLEQSATEVVGLRKFRSGADGRVDLALCLFKLA